MPNAFHDDPQLQQDLLRRLEHFIRERRIHFGSTEWEPWKGGRGSAAGIAACSSDAERFGEMFGYPPSLAAVLDPIAGELDEEDAITFIWNWVAMPRPGADLSRVPAMVAIDLLGQLDPPAELIPVVEKLIALHRREATGERVDRAEWAAARSAGGLDDGKDATSPPAHLLRLCASAGRSAVFLRSTLGEINAAWMALPVPTVDDEWFEEDWTRMDELVREMEERFNTEPGLSFPDELRRKDEVLAERFLARLDRETRALQARGAALGTVYLRHLCAAPGDPSKGGLPRRPMLPTAPPKMPPRPVSPALAGEADLDLAVLGGQDAVVMAFLPADDGKPSDFLSLVTDVADHFGPRLAFLLIDITRAPDLRARYTVERAPTFVLVREGTVRQRIAGVRLTRSILAEMLERGLSEDTGGVAPVEPA